MDSAFIFGPFIGELSWEFYRFAPYAIYLKKIFPKYKLVVLTRKERFDLYGQYADYLIPLKIENDEDENQIFFKMKNLDMKTYNLYINRLIKSFKKRVNIEKHIYPNIEDYNFRVRWQLPRSKMIYDFKPRNKNFELIREITKKTSILFTPPYDDYFMSKIALLITRNKLTKRFDFITNGYDKSEIFKDISKIEITNNSSELGLIIEVIKKSILTVGPKSDLIHLSLLMNTQCISWGNSTNIDKINPLNTKIFINDKLSYNEIEKYLLEKVMNIKNGQSYDSV